MCYFSQRRNGSFSQTTMRSKMSKASLLQRRDEAYNLITYLERISLVGRLECNYKHRLNIRGVLQKSSYRIEVHWIRKRKIFVHALWNIASECLRISAEIYFNTFAFCFRCGALISDLWTSQTRL